jgi:hypothetical protein
MEKTTNEDDKVVIVINPPVCVIAEVVGNAVGQ